MMRMNDLASSPAWLLAGWSMLHFLWVGAILGGLAAIGRRVLRGLGSRSDTGLPSVP